MKLLVLFLFVFISNRLESILSHPICLPTYDAPIVVSSFSKQNSNRVDRRRNLVATKLICYPHSHPISPRLFLLLFPKSPLLDLINLTSRWFPPFSYWTHILQLSSLLLLFLSVPITTLGQMDLAVLTHRNQCFNLVWTRWGPIIRTMDVWTLWNVSKAGSWKVVFATTSSVRDKKRRYESMKRSPLIIIDCC